MFRKGQLLLEEVFTTGWEGVKGTKRVELDAETKSYVDDILTHLKTENNKVSQNFNFLVRSILGKDINLMNKQDWFYLKNYFDDIKSGTWISNIKKKKGVPSRWYHLFPETVNREMMKDEIILMQEENLLGIVRILI